MKLEQRRFSPDDARRDGGEGDDRAVSPRSSTSGSRPDGRRSSTRSKRAISAGSRCWPTSTGRSPRRSAAVDIEAIVAEAHGLKPEDLAKEKCPKCGAQVELRSGRFGPYFACVNYKQTCDYVKSLEEATRLPTSPTDEKCQLCSAPMVIKTGRFGEFLACTRYPKCKGTRSIPLGIKCPKCDVGDLAERRTKRGKSFWGCVRYPACDFSTWNKPVPDDLPQLRLGGDGEEVQQGRGRDAAPASSAGTRSWSWTPRRPPRRECCLTRPARDRRRRRAGGLGGGLGPRGAGHSSGDPARCGPVAQTPAHQTDQLAELVCSNSFKSTDLTNAHGLLKAELRAAGQPAASARRMQRGCPAGSALAVDRDGVFRSSARAADQRHPTDPVVRGEVTELPSPGVVATGPLTSDAVGGCHRAAGRLGVQALAFYDAIAPIVRHETLDHSRLYRALPLRQRRRRRLPQCAARPRRSTRRSSRR